MFSKIVWHLRKGYENQGKCVFPFTVWMLFQKQKWKYMDSFEDEHIHCNLYEHVCSSTA